MSDNQHSETPADWSALALYLEHLTGPVRIVVWGDPDASWTESEAVRLVTDMSAAYPVLSTEWRPRAANYDFWPVIGIMGCGEGEVRDHGLRCIGLPLGYQLTALLGAIQAASFQGQSVDPRTRIQLSRLQAAADIELVTSAEDQVGPELATACFGLAVCSPSIRAFLIMADQFPVVRRKYGVQQLPHTVINGHVHIQGAVTTPVLMRHVAAATKK